MAKTIVPTWYGIGYSIGYSIGYGSGYSSDTTYAKPASDST